MTATAEIVVRVRLEGWHNWPGATGKRSYLGAIHRHLFHIAVTTDVRHDDREIEFHDLADFVRSCWPDGGWLGGQSCETIARGLADRCVAEYGRGFTVEVSEDGEFGAVVSVGV